MTGMEKFYREYPQQTMSLPMGRDFTYRYYKNPKAKAMLVLLTGGIGLSDLFYLHFEVFVKDFSVLTFDYQEQFADNKEFALAVSQLLTKLDEKAWLVGQSLGGIVAQIIAANHPDCVEGLVLSNTCSLSADMGSEAYEHITKMIEDEEKMKKMLPFIPFSLFKKLMKRTVMKTKTTGFTENEKNLMEDLCNAMIRLLTKPYQYHMADFMIDAQNHFGMKKKDFEVWDNKVLLILSEDDDTFNQPCKDSLIRLMTNPTVVTDITGGHLALLVRLEKYTDTIRDYIVQRAG